MRANVPTSPRLVDVPTTDAAIHLLTALYLAGIVQGRNRAPGVELWVSQLRTALCDVLHPNEVARVHAQCEDVRMEFERAS
jgi:hypothetical protein